MKIKFTCNTCYEPFNIDERNITNKENINCQNCGQNLPSEVITKIQQYVETKIKSEVYFNEAIKLIPEKEDKVNSFESQIWKIEINQ